MSDINNLAETLGLETRNRPSNNMPFTRAATTELNLAIQNQREQKRLQAEEARRKKEYESRIKGSPKGIDKFGIPAYMDSYRRTIEGGATPDLIAEHDFLVEQQKAETGALQSIKNTIDKMLVPKDIKDAYKREDYDYLRKAAKENPNLGIYVSETGRPLIDPTKIVADVNVDQYFNDKLKEVSKNEADFLPIKGKAEKSFGKVFQKGVVKPEILQAEANRFFTTDLFQSPDDALFERNYITKREREITAEMNNPKYAQLPEQDRVVAAAKQVFLNEASQKLVTKIDVTPKRSGSGGSKDPIFVAESSDNPNVLVVKARTSADLVPRRFDIIETKSTTDNGVSKQTTENKKILGIPTDYEPLPDGNVKVTVAYKDPDEGDVFAETTTTKGEVLDMLAQSPDSKRTFLKTYNRVVKPKAKKDKVENKEPKMSYVQWKAQNPNGTVQQFKEYLK